MDAYELNPTDAIPNIPANLHTIGAACDRWLERRGLGTNIRAWWSAQSRGNKTSVEIEPRSVKQKVAAKPKIRESKIRVPKPELTDEQRLANAKTAAARYRERNKERIKEMRRAEYLRNKGNWTPEQLQKQKEAKARWRAKNGEKLKGYYKKYAAEKLASMTPEELDAYKAMLAERRRNYYKAKKNAN